MGRFTAATFVFSLTMLSCTGRVPNPCTPCGDTCVDVKVDSANCGACGAVCSAGSVCAAGACRASCPSGQTGCDGGCFDLSVDPRHCGACGSACTQGVCGAGGCMSSCPTPLTTCGASCVDTRSDPANCGGCGLGCDGGLCGQGSCRASCPSPLTTCGASCVDTRSDPANCGGCGLGCDGGLCGQGSCRTSCPSPLTTCGAACVDTINDPTHCGACGVTCDAGVCGGASCRSLCALGTTSCNASCVDLQASPQHCGGCGVTCQAGPSSTAGCDAGRCGLTCAPGTLDCDGLVANGCESDLDCVVPITVLATGRLANHFPVPRTDQAPLALFDVSADGQRVAFIAQVDGLVAGDSNGRPDVFVRDVTTGTTVGLTHLANAFGPGPVQEVALSANGRYLAFISREDLSGQGADGGAFVYVWDAVSARTTRVINSNTHDEHDLSFSDDGSKLVFLSSATNLGGPATQEGRIFVAFDGGTALVFDAPTRIQDGGGCSFESVAGGQVSGDGRFVALWTNIRLIPADDNEVFDVYRVQLDGGGLVPLSLQRDGGLSTDPTCQTGGAVPELSGDGSAVAFHSALPLLGGAPGFSVYANRGATFPVSAQGVAAGFPSVDSAGLRFGYPNFVNGSCEWAQTSGAMATQTLLAPLCPRARVSANGKAFVMLTRFALNSSLDTNSAVIDGGFTYDLYLKFVP